MFTRKELKTMSKAGNQLIKSANQALAYARGEISDGFTVNVPEEIDVKSIRNVLGLTSGRCRIGNKNAVSLIGRPGFF